MVKLAPMITGSVVTASLALGSLGRAEAYLCSGWWALHALNLQALQKGVQSKTESHSAARSVLHSS